MKPQPSTSPISDSFSGDTGYRIEGITDHHMPSGYAGYLCVVHEIKLDMVSFMTMKVSLAFTIEGDPASLPTLYEEEQWKFRRTESVLRKNPAQAGRFKAPAPIFALLLNKYLQVVDASLRVRDPREKDPPFVFDQSCELILLPDSYPPLVGLPNGEHYSYYDKKATIFYSDLLLNTRYEAEIELEGNAGMFEFAPVFPYRKVVIEKFSDGSSGEYDYKANGLQARPTRSDKFPAWYEESIDHKVNIGEPRWANFKPASPFRGEVPLFDKRPEIMAQNPRSKREFLRAYGRLFVNTSRRIELNDYETLDFVSHITIPPDKDVEVNVRTIKRPLPTRIYDQMQKLPMYQDVLVRYDIFNLSDEKLHLRVETEIIGFTETARKIVFIHGVKNGKGKKAREVVFQCPRLKRGTLEELKKPEKATMRCTVTNEDTKEPLFDETRDIDLLANDEMLWEIKDIRSNTHFDLHNFICAWITPRDHEGRIEKVRTEAAKLRPSKAFGDSTTTLADYESHVRAVYDYLAGQGMTYVNQPFSSISLPSSQRVVLPEEVLKNNAGNCIDLTVLFASILEGAEMHALIFLTENHAFIGWGDKNNANEIIFLETTAIGTLSFDEAVKLGRKAFDDNFTLIGMPSGAMMPLFIGAEKGRHMVDTAEVRFSGQVSTRNT